MNWGGRPYICGRAAVYIGAGGRNRFLTLIDLAFYCFLQREVQITATFPDSPQTRMLAIAETVEVTLGGIAL